MFIVRVEMREHEM